MIDTAGPKAPAASSRPPVVDRRSLTRFAVIAVLLLLAIFALPPLMSGYYTDTMTQVAIYSIVTLGLGLLVGRVGLYSLGQLRSIPVTFAAAIVIGLVHDLITPITQISNYQDMTPFVLAAIALLVMSRGQVMTRSREEG